MLLELSPSALELELLDEAFPSHIGVCLVGFLPMCPSRASFRFGEGHPGSLAYFLIELGWLVANEGQIFRTSLPGANQGLPQREVHLGPVEGWLTMCWAHRGPWREPAMNHCSPVWTFQSIWMELESFSLYFSDPVYVKEILRIKLYLPSWDI